MDKPENALERGLSGYWNGVYTYGSIAASNPFTCELRESAGLLTGSTTEPEPGGSGEDVIATLTGLRDGSIVVFTKVYSAGQSMHEEPIVYDGTANAENTLIEGTWSLPTQPGWTGAFKMTRASRPASKVVRQEAVKALR